MLIADLDANDGEPKALPTIQEGNAKQAKTGRHPYMVSIRSSGGQHYCTGVLVSPSIVLTVAQCADMRATPFVEQNPTVWVGAYLLDKIRLDRVAVRQVSFHDCQSLVLRQ